VNFASAVGYKKITLWTQSILLAARRIYQKAGFRLVEEQANFKFGKDLVSQTWELDLTESGPSEGCTPLGRGLGSRIKQGTSGTY
jgi:hypothetical protein